MSDGCLFFRSPTSGFRLLPSGFALSKSLLKQNRVVLLFCFAPQLPVLKPTNMRKFTSLVFVIVCFAVTANAQITKGSLLIGGSLSIGQQKETTNSIGNQNTTYWQFSPMVGLAFKENTIGGISLSVSGLTTSSSNTENNSYGGGIFLRKYKPLGKGFYVFGETNAFYGFNKYAVSYPSGSSSSQRFNTLSLNLFPGVSYAVGKRFFLETTLTNLLSLHYTKTTSQTQDNPSLPIYKKTQTSYGVGAGAGGNIPINLGFRFIFP